MRVLAQSRIQPSASDRRESGTTANLGMEFMRALSDAIGTYTSEAVAAQPQAFVHRGVDLRFAVERALFFALVNDEELYGLLVRARCEGLAGTIELTDGPAALIAPYLLGHVDVAVRAVDDGRPDHRHVRGWFARTHRRVADLLRPSPHAAAGPDVLLYVHSPKFVAYLQPVTERLRMPYAYLCTGGVDEFLTRGGFPRLTRRPAAPVSVPILASGLRAWPGVVARFEDIYATLVVYKPRCVVVVEGNAPDDEVMNRAAAQLRIPTVCMQQGWAQVVHSGFRNMSYTKMLVWGPAFADLLQEWNPCQRFVATGHIRLDEGASAEATRSSSRDAIAFFLQAPSLVLSVREWTAFLELAVRTAREFPQTPVLVREHPGFPLRDYEWRMFDGIPNIRRVSPSTVSLSDVLRQCAITVSVYSSTVLESIACGVLPVVVTLTSASSYFPNLDAEGCAIQTPDVESAAAAIRRCMTDPSYVSAFKPAMVDFRRRYFSATGSTAADLAVREIVAVAASS